ncbi:MAG TPA: hypothetical protein VHM24_05445 [Gemmatimonadaceae bacterium]|nr:hypothetical protein [Gemmatimonadaceae bacterium]
MSKAKTNALDALRALIAERQQYEQWITTLEAKKEGTPEHVFERVKSDYLGRLERVVKEIRGHAEELQLSISALSSRLVEVAREEDTRREGLQEAELRAAVGEYEQQEWEQLRNEAEAALEKIGADRAALDGQLAELRSIQKLSEVSTIGSAPESTEAEPAPVDRSSELKQGAGAASPDTPQTAQPIPSASRASSPTAESANQFAVPSDGSGSSVRVSPPERAIERPSSRLGQSQERLPLEPVVSAAPAGDAGQRAKSSRTPPRGLSAVRRSEAAKSDQSKSLKCPECGTPNYPTEWYCERCGGELATM